MNKVRTTIFLPNLLYYMITIIYQFKHNVMWHCRINQFFSFPEQLQIWIYVFLVGDHRYIYIYIYIYIANVRLLFIVKLFAPRYMYIMPMIVSNNRMHIVSNNCEQQFQTLSCVSYTIYSVVKLVLCIRALLLDQILALKKILEHLAYILLEIAKRVVKANIDFKLIQN